MGKRHSMLLYKKIQDASYSIKKKVKEIPALGMILGTGLGGLVDEIQVDVEIPYSKIAHFPVPSVVSHGDKMIFGKLNGQSVVILTGRLHYYEGYSMEEVTFGVSILAHLGIKQLLITNITGSVNPSYKVGEIVLIKDHINLQSANPLRPQTTWFHGIQERRLKHDDRLGPRYPSMINAYDSNLRTLTKNLAKENNIPIHEGVYVAMNGPSLETPAEYNMIKILGGDIVGMSTVPEVIVASQKALKTVVLSIVSNQCYPVDQLQEDSIDTILKNVEKGVPSLKKLIYAILQSRD